MSSAVRLTPDPPAPVAVAGTGPFGTRCAELLAAGLPGSRTLDASEITATFATRPGAVVLALWRPEPGLCEAADELAFRHRVPWLPVVMEHPVIRVGPVVRPPVGPCFGCYARRRAQHDGQPWATAALRAAYDRDQACGARGYLPHHARLAAAVAHTMLHPGAVPLDTVSTIRLVTGGLSAGRVVACHGCARCGTGAPPGRPGWLEELPLRMREAAAVPGADPRLPQAVR